MIWSIIIAVVLIFSFLLAGVKEENKGWIALVAVLLNAGLSSWIGVRALGGHGWEQSVYGGPVFGEIALRVDALSGWFILLTNFTLVTGVAYGICYMRAYKGRTAALTLHYVSYIWNQAAMIGVLCVQHALAFLCVWEIMTITAFLLVIFEHGKIGVLKGGINYLIQAHVSILVLTLAFIWINAHTGSYDFRAIAGYSARIRPALSFLLFLFFFAGFAIKAGFVPFHTWLPYAHPVAPAHISGIMSGVLIKMGIFGMLRMLLLIKTDLVLVGYMLLVVSVASALYGVLLAIVQHNVKKLLAYHSIENIGIIGMGMGLGCLGLAWHNAFLAFAGFAGALLHTLNHSLFKSLLFYTAGTVYQYAHTMDIERLGGLIKKLPQTGALFLLASMAICGLVPFNGFISEFLLYSGLFRGIASGRLSAVAACVFVVFGLALVGGLAMLCFTKAFGIIFLGTARHRYPGRLREKESLRLTREKESLRLTREGGPLRLIPQYVAALPIVFIGLFPQLIIPVLAPVVGLFTGGAQPDQTFFPAAMRSVSLSAMAFVFICLVLFLVRQRLTTGRENASSPTWGCGYVAPTHRMQYTANSYVRSCRKLIRPLLQMNKSEGEISGVFPPPIRSVTHPYDKLEALVIDRPLRALRGLLGRFKFLQNGSEQYYILYGVSFIVIAMLLPILADAAWHVINLFKQL
ncbi:MAG TPA: proton-conducting transporter membrane subunit [Puia sp.]|nr:proton-conducting transporter membrane subunit [Puia sp.]